MLTKRIFAILLVWVLLAGSALPVLATVPEYTTQLPEQPSFEVSVTLDPDGYKAWGTLGTIHPDTARIRPVYSLDGDVYQAVSEDTGMDWLLDGLDAADDETLTRLRTQPCLMGNDEPLKSYIAEELDRFFLRLEITLQNGVTYDSAPALVERETSQPPSDNIVIHPVFPRTMRVWDPATSSAYGKYQITARETAEAGDIAALLPSTVPVELQLMDVEGSIITTEIVRADVSWKELPKLTLAAGETFVVADAAEDIIIPAGTEIRTPVGSYILPENIGFDDSFASDEIRLSIYALGSEEKPEISLRGTEFGEPVADELPLSLAFTRKPSGATSIKVYSFAQGDEDWTELCELLELRDVDANQSAQLYGYMNVLQPTESPYREYLQGELSGFMLGLIIEGGTYNGEKVILSWLEEYDPPDRIPELSGSGGNQNNAGSGDGSGDGSDDGQRPDLPNKPSPEPDPPLIVYPPNGGDTDTGPRPEESPLPSPVPSAEPEESPPTESLQPSPTESIQPSPTESLQPSPTNPNQPETGLGSSEEKPDNLRPSVQPSEPVEPPSQDSETVPTLGGADSELDYIPPEASANPDSSDSKKSATQRAPSREGEDSPIAIPIAAAAAVVLVGGGIAIAAGTSAAGGAASGGIFGKALSILRKLFFK